MEHHFQLAKSKDTNLDNLMSLGVPPDSKGNQRQMGSSIVPVQTHGLCQNLLEAQMATFQAICSQMCSAVQIPVSATLFHLGRLRTMPCRVSNSKYAISCGMGILCSIAWNPYMRAELHDLLRSRSKLTAPVAGSE